MPKISNDAWESATESTGGDAPARMEPGVYQCVIQAVRTEWDDSQGKHWTSEEKEYVKLIIDIDEGEFAGRFSDEYWAGPDKDWGHTLYMSWKPQALGMLKHTLRGLSESNPGFDAKAAFDADRWGMFIGKKLVVYWSGEEYESNRGETRVRVRPDTAMCPGEERTAKVKLLNESRVDWEDYKAVEAMPPRQQDQPAPAAYDGSDIPF